MTHEITLRDALRQMLALLEAERQALAGFDRDGILNCAREKLALCDIMELQASGPLDDECRGMIDGVARLNEINRKIRNLATANIDARLASLAGRAGIYDAGRMTNPRDRAQHG